MSSLLSKLTVFISVLLGLLNGPNYISTDVESFKIDYNSGDQTPIIRTINVKNTGIERATFTIKSSLDWIFVYREFQPNTKLATLSIGSSINFVLEIHAEQVEDGKHEGIITIEAVHLTNGTIFDSKDIEVEVRKNYEETPTPTSEEEEEETLTSEPIETETPESTEGPSTTSEPTEIKSPTPTPISTLKSSSTPTITKEPVTTLEPIKSPLPSPSRKDGEDIEERRSFIKSILDLMKKLFF